MDFTLRMLEHVLAVAECGSITEAAAKLGLTQSGLSRSISSLEAAWSVTLFERGQKGVRLTSVGSGLLVEARRLLEAARTVDHNMKLRSSGEAGRVAFATAPLIGSIVTGPILTRSLQQTPGISLSASVRILPDILRNLSDDIHDFGLFSEFRLPKADGVEFEELGTMPLAFAVREDHPLGGNLVSPQEFAEYPMAASPYVREVRLVSRTIVECDSYLAMRDALLKTDAVCLTSPWLIRESLQEGTARILEMGEFRPHSPTLYLARVGARLLSPAAQRIIAHAKAIIAQLQATE